jgi:beta-galactosidase
MHTQNQPQIWPEIEKLIGEPPAVSTIKTERGAPRLFVNGKEVYPLLAWSWGLVESAPIFKQAAINLLHPILGLNAAWPEPEAYDWSEFDRLFARLLAQNPQAFFLPRVLLDVPDWWKEKNPSELIQCALQMNPAEDTHYRPVRRSPEGGMLWGIQLREPSLASEVWKSDMENLFRGFLRHIENSPLRSRIIGYQIGGGIYGEWHYFVSEFLPDMSTAMQQRLGYVPDAATRMKTTFGLLRDPQQEKPVIDFFRRFHEGIDADTLLHFARMTKEETNGRVICGAFNAYLLENVWIQEGGHLSPEKILASPYIDFIASPYSYQTTNLEERQWWEHDVVDEAGNYLGRARGVAGDGGYRVLLESLRRHGKLYFVEIDPSTHLEPAPINPDGSGGTDVEKELCMIGGAGSTTPEGTQKILQRDLGQMFVRGNAGWLFDFGPVLRTGKSWYADENIIAEVKRFSQLGELRRDLDMSSCAQIAAVYDAKSFFVTRHWRAEAPFPKGGVNVDYFSRWFMDSQARAFHRLGAPMDFMYRFDLRPDDVEKYRLFFMVNLFYLTSDEVSRLRDMLRNSGATVVWYYVPGFVTPEKLDLAQMERLTGFRFNLMTKPGPMLIQARFDHDLQFGVKSPQYPRFGVTNQDAMALGYWTDCHEVAFAWKEVEGWNSVYVGAAPLPVEILRWLAKRARAELWSTQPDIVMATQDAAMLVATSKGGRTFTLPKPMTALEGDEMRQVYDLNMEMGEVEIFTGKSLKRQQHA